MPWQHKNVLPYKPATAFLGKKQSGFPLAMPMRFREKSFTGKDLVRLPSGGSAIFSSSLTFMGLLMHRLFQWGVMARPER